MRRPPEPEPDDRPTSRGTLILAGIVVLLFQQCVPMGRVVLYPFTLLATWVHESGHGIAALVCGGWFHELHVYGDASGLAMVGGYRSVLDGAVCISGLLGPPIVGASVLAFSRGPRRARIALATLAALLGLSVVLWVRTVVGLVVMPLIGVVFAWAAWRASERRVMMLAQAVGILLGLDLLARIDYLFTQHATIGGVSRSSDIARVAEAWGGNYLLWGALVAFVGMGMCALGMYAAWWRRAVRQPVGQPVRQTVRSR